MTDDKNKYFDPNNISFNGYYRGRFIIEFTPIII